MANDNKRELIIQAAIDILNHQNYQNMTTSEIARGAGIAEGTIYRYFQNKRELFVEVLKHISKRMANFFVDGVSPDADLQTNLRVLAENFYVRHKDSNVLYKILYKSFSEVEDDEIKETLGNIYTQSVDIIKSILKNSLGKNKMGISEKRLEMVIFIMWGIGDIMWKRSMVTGEESMSQEEMGYLAEMISTLMSG